MYKRRAREGIRDALLLRSSDRQPSWLFLVGCRALQGSDTFSAEHSELEEGYYSGWPSWCFLLDDGGVAAYSYK
jgi:hypothetical protein